MEDTGPVWDRIWQEQTDTLAKRDVLYMVDEMKLEYTLRLLRGIQGKITTIEIGSGSGRLSCFLASAGYWTTCLDYSPNALRVCSNNYELTKNEGNFIMADAQSIPFKSNSFDVVLSTGLLEHFVDAQPIVNEMVRILKPGGYFISDIVPKKLLVPFKLSYYFSSIVYGLLFWILRRGKNPYQLDIHEQKLNKQDIRHLLESAGLEDINVFPAGVVPPPPLDLPRAIPFEKHVRRIYNEVVYLYNEVVYRLKPFFKIWDGTLVAEWFGLYYYVHAIKPR
jgi:ubiquinone/menaquinone biosynthesis C-methylase UbiE